MASSDALSHASLNGLYIKAQELDRGHAAPPPQALAPPGSTVSSARSQASAHASTSNASAHATGTASKTTKTTADYSTDYSFSYDDSTHTSTVRFHCFDTPNSICLFGTDARATGEQLLIELKDLCLELHMLWSFSRTGSDISRLNERVSSVVVDPRTAQLLAAMLTFHQSEPLYDFSIGRLSFLWKRAQEVPSAKTIDVLLELTGASKLHIDGTRIVKDEPRLQVDVGGCAKGAVADLLADAIRAHGWTSAQVNLGGNLYLVGEHPSGRPWTLDIAIPDGVPAQPVTLELSDASAVTSGNYERYIVLDGKRYQHIIDPRTGWPSESDLVSVTVIGSSSLLADMLATTACVSGSQGFEALCARHEDYRFVAIRQDGTVLDSTR